VGGGYLVLDEGVKDFLGRDGLVVIQVVLLVDVKTLNCGFISTRNMQLETT